MRGLFAWTAAILTAASAPALAAESWTGFYIGAEAGATWSDADMAPTDPAVVLGQVSNVVAPGRGVVVVPGRSDPRPAISASDDGFNGGVFAGYDFQFDGGFVLGIEGAIGTGGMEASGSYAFTVPATVLTAASTVTLTRAFESDWTASINLKAGFVTGDALIYATGGVAFSEGTLSAIDSFPITAGPGATSGGITTDIGPIVGYPSTSGSARASKSLTGWTAGAGVDYALGGGLTIGLVYRHTEFSDTEFATAISTTAATLNRVGTTTVGGIGNSIATSNDRLELSEDRVSLRVAWRFGG